MDKKRYVLIGASAVIIVFLSVLAYGSSTAFKTSGTPKVTYFDVGEISLPVKGYKGTYVDLEKLAGNVDRITVYYTKDDTIAKYLESVDYNIHAEKLEFLDKFMIFCHRNGTTNNPVILVEEGDLSITVVRNNVFIIKARNLEEIQSLFAYASEHVYDLATMPYKVVIPFSIEGETFNLSAFSVIQQTALSENQNAIFSIIRTPLINKSAEKLYLLHTPWEGAGEENRELTKGVAYISNIFGRVRPEMIEEATLIITDITLLDKLMIYMEIIGTEESPIYAVRTAADNAEEDGIYIPREGFIYLEVINYEDIEKFSMGLATILGGS